MVLDCLAIVHYLIRPGSFCLLSLLFHLPIRFNCFDIFQTLAFKSAGLTFEDLGFGASA